MPKFHVIKDENEQIGIRFQSEDDARLFKQEVEDILAKHEIEESAAKLPFHQMDAGGLINHESDRIKPPDNVSCLSSKQNFIDKPRAQNDDPSESTSSCYTSISSGKLPPAPPLSLLSSDLPDNKRKLRFKHLGKPTLTQEDLRSRISEMMWRGPQKLGEFDTPGGVSEACREAILSYIRRSSDSDWISTESED